MKYRLLSVGVMIGATAIVEALKKKENSEKGKKKLTLSEKRNLINAFVADVETEDGKRFNVTVRAANREQALSKIEKDMADVSVLNIGRAL